MSNQLPAGSSGTQGRARLVIISGRGSHVESEMALVSASGEVLWRGEVATGGWGNGALPGMDESRVSQAARGRAVIGEYPLNYTPGTNAGYMASRPDMPTFSYADGRPGFSLGITNPSNISELGGAGRNHFRIHPGGQRLQQQGRDNMSEGCIKIETDAQARAFERAIMNLPANQRPASLEILNSRMTPNMNQALGGAATLPPESPRAGETETDTQERRRRETAAEAERASDGNGIMEMFSQLITWLFSWLFGDGRDGLNEGERDETPVSTGDRLRIGRQIISSGAQSAWENFRNQNRGQAVNHISPVGDDVVVTSDMGHRHAPRTAGGRRGSSNHAGLDLDTDNGNNRATIRASAAGVVLFAGNNGNGYGNHVIIGHADGTTSFYGHLDSLSPNLIGTTVTSGQSIGVMGTTGNSSGIHLHYEQRRTNRSGDMVAYDPVINGRTWSDGQRMAAAAASPAVPSLAASGVTGGESTGGPTAPPPAVAAGSRAPEIRIAGIRIN